jgi:putative PIN family toxin of toxin-antitoxin system
LLLQEVAEALWEEKIRKYHQWTPEQHLAFVARLHRQSHVTPGQLHVRLIAEDLDDNAVLACAHEGIASSIVTVDRHLLSIGAFKGIAIISPVHFLRPLAEHQD